MNSIQMAPSLQGFDKENILIHHPTTGTDYSDVDIYTKPEEEMTPDGLFTRSRLEELYKKFGNDTSGLWNTSYLENMMNYFRERDNRPQAEKDGEQRDEIIDHLFTLAENGDVSALETLFNYYSTRADSLEARDYAAKREDTQYQRLVADLQKAGISPYILSGASPVSLGYSTKSYSGSQMTSQSNNQVSNQSGLEKQAISSILGLIGIIIGAIIMAA